MTFNDVYTGVKYRLRNEDRDAVFRTCFLLLPFSSYAESVSAEVLCSNVTRDLTNAYNFVHPIIISKKKTLDINKHYIPQK